MTSNYTTAIAMAFALSASACAKKDESAPVLAPVPQSATATIPIQNTSLQPASLADTIERVMPSVVRVTCTSGKLKAAAANPNPSPVPPPAKPPEGKDGFRQGHGTGVVIDSAKGYIMTNEHVVAECDMVKVSLHGDERRLLTAAIIGKDENTDIAVLKIGESKSPGQAVIGDDSKLRLGDNVFAIGHPFGFHETVTRGIVSAKNRGASGPYGHHIQTDVAINPGNSGGPLFNEGGQVVGINTLIYTHSGQFGGISFSVPITQAKWVADRLIEKGSIPWGFLGVGIGEVDEDTATKASRTDLKGVWINSISDNSPARGILQKNDIVLRVNGKDVNRPEEMAFNVAKTMAGNTARLDVWRENKMVSLDIRVGARPTEDNTVIKVIPLIPR